MQIGIMSVQSMHTGKRSREEGGEDHVRTVNSESRLGIELELEGMYLIQHLES